MYFSVCLFCGGGLVTKSCPTLATHGLQPARLLCPWDSPGITWHQKKKKKSAMEKSKCTKNFWEKYFDPNTNLEGPLLSVHWLQLRLNSQCDQILCVICTSTKCALFHLLQWKPTSILRLWRQHLPRILLLSCSSRKSDCLKATHFQGKIFLWYWTVLDPTVRVRLKGREKLHLSIDTSMQQFGSAVNKYLLNAYCVPATVMSKWRENYTWSIACRKIREGLANKQEHGRGIH